MTKQSDNSSTPIGSKQSKTRWLACASVALVAGFVAVEELEAQVRGGTIAAPYQYEAVGQVPGCTATLVNNGTVLTSAHCFCSGSASNRICSSNAWFTLKDVFTVASPSVRTTESIFGTVLIHPQFDPDNDIALENDYALVKLNTPANQIFNVTPIQVQTALPAVGQAHTFVGFGPSGYGCSSPTAGTKTIGTATLERIQDWGAQGNKVLYYQDANVGLCPGDSGGPGIGAEGKIIGLHAQFLADGVSGLASTATAFAWIRDNAVCPVFDRTLSNSDFCDDPLCPCAPAEGDCDQQWQCSIGTTCLADVGAAVGMAGTEDLCWSNQQVISFYRDVNYGGPVQHLPVGTWDYATLAPNIGNDTISSLIAAPGLSVDLWSESGCWYSSGSYSRSVANVGGMNEATSCLTVHPGVSIYASQSYAGVGHTLRVGGYNHAGLGGVGNDNAESMIASPGIQVRICSESGTPGTVGWGPSNNPCQDLSGRVASLGALNNNVSNVEVLAGVTVYREIDYGGVAQTFRQGTYSGSGGLNVVGVNQISSLVVAPGKQATLCAHPSGPGYGICKTYTGWNSFVGANMNDVTQYINVF